MGRSDDNYTEWGLSLDPHVHRLSLGEARTSLMRWDVEGVGGIEVSGFCRGDWWLRVSPDIYLCFNSIGLCCYHLPFYSIILRLSSCLTFALCFLYLVMC